MLLIPAMLGLWNPGLFLWLSWYRIHRNEEDLGLIPELGRSPGEGEGYPLQYSMDCVVHGAAKSRT